MTRMNTPKLPRLEVDADPYDEVAVSRSILDYAAKLVADEVPPVFEVWYPATTMVDYDVVEVSHDGMIETVPSFEGEPSDG